ncbi:MAG: hypothetical protein LBI42_04435, partial [Chitinispirillales bacterium]|nr:hypothetical protein [Chitinispirillales bacterium]
MRRLIVFAFCVIGISYGQTREEIKAFAENYAKDSTVPASFQYHAKREGISVKPEDLSIKVIEMYRFKYVSLNANPDTIPFSEIIEPSGFWRILVMAHNKPFYEIFLDISEGLPGTIGGSSISSDNYIWGPLLKDYPERANLNPVLFTPLGVPFIPEHAVLYFKQKGPRQIHYLGLGRFKEPSLKGIN